MTRPRFSLSALFVVISVVAVAVAGGERLASERVLLGVWLLALLTSFWRSSERDWKRVLEVTTMTGVVWLVCTVGTHLMYARGLGLGVVLSRALLITLVGFAAAFVGACLLSATQLAVDRWRAAPLLRRFVSLATPLVLLALVWTAWSAWNAPYWQPTALTASSQDALLRHELVRRITSQHAIGGHGRVVFSPDGSLLAVTCETEIFVFAVKTQQLVATLAVAAAERVESTGFLPDNRGVVALVRCDENRAWRLVRWQSTDWTAADAMSLDAVLDQLGPGDSYPSLAGHRILIVSMEGGRVRGSLGALWFCKSSGSAADARVEVRLLDLEQGGTLVEFPALAGVLTAELLAEEFATTLNVSPNGKWIVASQGEASRWAFGPGEMPPRKLPGRGARFLADGDRLVLDQTISWLASKGQRRSRQIETPFWGHFERSTYFRLLLFDCRRNRVLTRSRWRRGGGAQMTPDRRALIDRRGNTVLRWDVPPADR